MQRKRSNEKIARRKINFPTNKTCFFPPFLSEPLLLSKLLTFSFLVHLKCLNCSWSITFNSTNHFWTLITLEQHTRSFLGVWELNLQCSVVCLFCVLDPSNLRGHNFVNCNMFLKIFSAPDAPIGGVQVLIGHQLFGSGMPLALNCSLTGHSTLVIPGPRPLDCVGAAWAWDHWFEMCECM